MANEQHLAILKQGVEVWDEWRSENPDVKVDLTGVDLTGADLSNANLGDANLSSAKLSGAELFGTFLGDANLSRADLSGADLREAYLTEVNLRGANLSGANLSGVNLSRSNVIATNFHNATLTGACIKDWSVNSETKLDKVVCEYVYLSSDYDAECGIKKPEERRPIEGNFLPGELAGLYKKIIETTDLILRKTPESANTANNQGVKFNFNNKTHTWQRLTFRSKTEIKIAEALDRAEVLFLPNCLARLNTPNGRANKEADFLICYNGKWGILEVDGPYHTPERRVEEQERERIFRRHGIKVVERFDSSRCYENPDAVVQEFFKMLEIGYS